MSEVNEIFCWVAKDPSGVEGIISIPGPAGLLPLVATERRIIDKTRRAAAIAAEARGQTAYLKRFLVAEVLDTIIPPTAN